MKKYIIGLFSLILIIYCFMNLLIVHEALIQIEHTAPLQIISQDAQTVTTEKNENGFITSILIPSELFWKHGHFEIRSDVIQNMLIKLSGPNAQDTKYTITYKDFLVNNTSMLQQSKTVNFLSPFDYQINELKNGEIDFTYKTDFILYNMSIFHFIGIIFISLATFMYIGLKKTIKRDLALYSYILSCCCVLAYFIFILSEELNVVRFIGESDDYMLLTVALEKNFSDLITPEVIEQAKIDYPDLPWEIEEVCSLPVTIDNVSYSWYFVTYPLLCLPIKFLLKLFGFHQIYAFYLTNLFLLLIAVAFSLKWLQDKICCKAFYAPLLLLSVNLSYLFWPSNEVCCMSFLILACSALFSGRYALSSFFAGLAATLNVTCFLFFPLIYLSYFYRNTAFLSLNGDVLRQCFIDLFVDRKKVILMLFGAFIGFIPIFINLYRWNKIAVMQSMGTTEGLFERFSANLLDLNFGILPYYPFILLIFFSLLLVNKREYYFYFVTVCCIILSYSLMVHIDCGMSYMSRYCSWIMTLILIGIFYYTHKFIHNFYLLTAFKSLFLLSAIYSIGILTFYIPKANDNNLHNMFHPIAKKVLDFDPSLYNPLFTTFKTRINPYVGTGYDFYNYLPIEYIDENNDIRKVLLETAQIENYIDTKIFYIQDWKKKIEKERQKANNIGKKYQYLNFPVGIKKSVPVMPCNIMLYPHSDNEYKKCLFSGWSHPGSWGVWTDSKEALLVFNFGEMKPKQLFLDLNVFGKQHVAFYLDNYFLGEYDLKDKARLYLDLSSAEITSKIALLRIKVPMARSPKSFGRGEDTRELGIGLKGFMLISK